MPPGGEVRKGQRPFRRGPGQSPGAAPGDSAVPPLPRSLARNFLALAVSRVVQIASGFFVLLAVARTLPLDDYGQYATITALAGAVVAVTYFGIQQIMIRDLVGNRHNAPAIIGRAVLLRLLLTIVAAVVLAGIGFFSGYSGPVALALGLAFGVEACRAMAMLGCAVFQAYERMGYEPPLSIVSGLASLTFTGLALWQGWGFVGVLAGLCAAAGLHMALVWHVACKYMTRPLFVFDRAALWKMLATSSVVGLGVFFHQNLFRANTLALSWLADLSAVADFQAPHEFILKLEILPQALMLAVFPILSRLAPVDPGRAAHLYRTIFRHTLQAMALPSILLAFYAEPACMLLFGHKFGGSVLVLRLLALALAPLALDMLVNNLLVAIGRQRYALYYAAAALVLNAGANAYAVPRYGVDGSAVVALGSYLWLLAFSTRFAARHGYGPQAFGPLLRVFGAGSACLGVCYPLRHIPLVGAAAGAVAYVTVLVALRGFRRSDIAELRAVMQVHPPLGKKTGEHV